MTKRNEVGVVSTTRTGPSHGPGRRTTNSSPTSMPPSSPVTFRKRANSVGASWFGSRVTRAIRSSGDMSVSRMHTR